MVSSQQEPQNVSEPLETADSPPGNVVEFEHGRERRHRQGSAQRVRPERPDRADQKERRREAKAEKAARSAPDVHSEGELAEVAAVETAVALSDDSAVQHALLSAPVVSTSNTSPKSVERLQSTFDGAQQVMVDKQDVTATVAPLVRHVNMLTEMLNASQVTLGRVQMERDVLRLRLAEQLNVSPESLILDTPTDTVAPDGSMVQVKARTETASAKTPSRFGQVLGSTGLVIQDGHTKEQISKTARRRQMLAVVILTAVGIGLYIAQRNGKDVTGFSRDSLAELQYVGIFFNVFLMMWMLYRVARVGGKGARWLFPNSERSRPRRR